MTKKNTPEEEKIALLKANFPNCFDKKGAFIPAKLQEMVEGSGVALSHESYTLNWLGKSYARLLANENIRTWLKADEAHNALPENANSQNLLIKGDNLEVLKHLMGAYSEQVKMIYIDPPYNTGGDGFVYADDRKFTVEQLSNLAGVDEDEAKRILEFTNSSSNSHSAWLTFMYPRLYLAKELLRDDGVIFISIDENEQAQLKILCDEVFGPESFVECICWNKRIPKNDKGIGNIHEYILVYVKSSAIRHEFLMAKDGLEEINNLAAALKKKNVDLGAAEAEVKKLYKKNNYDRGITLYNSMDEDYRLWGKINMSWPNPDTSGPTYNVLHPKTGKTVKLPDRGWRWKEDSFNDAAKIVNGKYQSVKERHDGSFVCGSIWFASDENTQPSSITYLHEVENFLLRSILSTKSDGGVELEKLFNAKSYFSRPKSTSLIKTLISSLPKNGSEIILDFFAGSGTTAHAVMDFNVEFDQSNKFICIQIDEATDKKSNAYKAGYKSIVDITKARIGKVASKIRAENPEYQGDLGFKVYEMVAMPDHYQDTPEELTENLELFDVSTLSPNGRHNLMRTWALQDNIPLTQDFIRVDLAGYTAYEAKHLLYFIEPNLSLESVVKLLEQLDNNPNFKPSRLVVLGYLLESKTQREITEAIKHYNNRKGIELTLDIRF